MPNQEIDDFTALTTPAAGDLVPIVDISDTTDSAQGTTKKITVSDLVAGGVLPDDSVTNAKLANMAQSTIKGRAAGAGTGDPTDLTSAQATAILDNVVGDSGSGGTKGLAPAPAAGDAAAGKFLKADGTYAVPPGSTLTADGLSAPVYAADAGATDAYAITLSPVPSGYTTGTHYRFKANTANTGACTLNVNSLGAKTIKKAQGGITTDLADNDIRAGQFVDVVYDGTNLQMQSTLGNTPSGGGTNPTSTRIPYNNAGTFADSELIRHSLYHLARQDSTFTGGNNRIFDIYHSSDDNTATPASYNRVRLQNSGGGDWNFLAENATVSGGHFHVGTQSGTRLYLKTGGTDRWFIGESNGHIHCNTDGGADIGTAGGNRPANLYTSNRVDVAGTSLTTGGSSIVDATGVSGNHSTFRFQILRAIRYVDLAQTMSIGAGAYNWNLLSGALIRQTLTANMTQAPTVSNEILDQILEVQLIQDATGSRTMIWPTNFKFAGATAPTLSTTAARRDIFRFRYDGTNWHEFSRSMDVG